MAIDPATVATVIEIGTKLYEFIDKVSNKGEKGDQLQPIIAKLDQIKASINVMGERLRKDLDGAVDTILDDIRLTQQSRIPGAHAAITDYLRTHPDTTQLPDLNNPNYVNARTTTLDVKTYFRSHHELAFMGGFIQAMNARIEFITALDQCWMVRNPEYVAEIRDGVNHLNAYLGYLRNRISAGITVKLATKMVVTDPTTKPPLKEPVSYTASVVEGSKTLWTKTVPATDDQPAKVKSEANGVRAQHANARQKEVLSRFDQIVATWNGLVANAAVAAARQALLPNDELALDPHPALAVTALPDLDTAAATGKQDLPLREAALQVLDTPEFQRRNARLNGRAVAFWFEKALSRRPTDEEAEALASVLDLFGHKAFFRALTYSTEYESRWGAGVPS
jgi:hypothetical protein